MDLINWAAEFMSSGGIFMWIIFVVWCMGIAISLERSKRYFSFSTNSKKLMSEIRKHIIANEVPRALRVCSDTSGLLPKVIQSGLERATRSKEEMEDALEGSILEVVPLINNRLSYLALCANLSTLLGLLGTIQGLIQSFAAVAQAEASQKAQLLAEGIAVAMNTTALGLVSAISLMVVHSWLMTRGEQMIHEIEENSVKLVDLVNTKKAGVSQNKVA